MCEPNAAARRGVPALVIAAAVLGAAPGASAGPTATYTLTGTLDGSIGATTLTDDPFTWTLVGNLGAPTTLAGFPALPAISDTIALGGVGTATASVPTYVAQNTVSSAVGFANAGLSEGMSWTAAALAAYALHNSLGPLPVGFQADAGPLSTSLGTLSISSASGLVFTAQAPPVPPISYTLTGNLTGTFGGTTLTNDPFTWTMVANADAPTTIGGLPALTAISDTITLAGIGSETPSSTLYAALNASLSDMGFSDGALSEGLTWTASALASYPLGDAIGPLPVSFIAALPVSTSGGSLDITSASNLVLNGVPLPAAVPEPATLALLGVPLAALGMLLRRRLRSG